MIAFGKDAVLFVPFFFVCCWPFSMVGSTILGTNNLEKVSIRPMGKRGRDNPAVNAMFTGR